jgi:type II secretory pathway predicted ATPase ExeA
MYPQFFGLEKLPFRLRPDLNFLYSGYEYRRVRGELLAALGNGPRVVLLTGLPGVGKTLLLEDVLGQVAGRFALCRINQPYVSPVELVQALLLQLGAHSADLNADLPGLMTELAATIDAAPGATPLLVVDDAQLLAGTTLHILEDILSCAPRLKILLAAQSRPGPGPGPGSSDLAALIPVAESPRLVHLKALSAEETTVYVERRLALAGAGGKGLFTADAYAMIFQLAGGTARLINVLCDAALHAACLRASGQVSPAEVRLATEDSRWSEALGRQDAMTSAPAPEAPARLLVRHGAEQLGAWPLKTGRMSIGRATDNEMRLEKRCVSRHHCHVVTVGDVSTIEDLGSVNGICVNGKAVKRHVLQNRDQIILGEYLLSYLAG